jgi:hypothetical protein
VLGFIGEVAAVALAAGILIGVGEAASNPKLPDWAPAIIIVGGGDFSLYLCGRRSGSAKPIRSSPGLVRGPLGLDKHHFVTSLGSMIAGMMALLLGPLGWLAICLGSVFVIALGPGHGCCSR